MLTKKLRLSTARALAIGAVSALVLAGCADDGSTGGNGGGGEGVAAGATIEEYQKAFEDVDTITLNSQTSAPKGSATGLPQEKYQEAVTEWSGGKIQWNTSYSNAVATATEADNALTDGRLDFTSVLPIYEPSEYPANAALVDTGFISSQSAINGTLQSNAWPNQVAFENEEIMAEFEDHGIVPLIPVFNSGAQGIFCADAKTSLSDLKGANVTASGVAQTAQLKALGSSPVSITYTEIFESLQRGVVDCSNSSLTVGVLGGFIAEAPNLTISNDAGFALAPGSMGFSKDTWDTLPLVAQQLLWDRTDVFVQANIADKIWVNDADAAAQIRKAGGTISEFADDAQTALQAENDKMLADQAKNAKVSDPAGLVQAAQDAAAEWKSTVDGLGFEDIGYEDFDKNYQANDEAMTKYTDAVNDLWASHRPS